MNYIILQLFYVHHIIGRSSLTRGDPGFDLGLQLGVCNELFVFEPLRSVSIAQLK